MFLRMIVEGLRGYEIEPWHWQFMSDDFVVDDGDDDDDSIFIIIIIFCTLLKAYSKVTFKVGPF